MSTVRDNIRFRDSIVEFNHIRTNALTGNLVIEITDTPSWMLCFFGGRLAGISGGIDAVERWQRNLALASLTSPLGQLVKSHNSQEAFLNSNKIAQEFAAKEVLFDIIQFSQNNGDKLSCRFIPIVEKNTNLQSNLPLLDVQPILTVAIQSWQEWSKNGLTAYAPSLFPRIRQSELIRNLQNIEDLQTLITAIDGNKSLRSLAIYNQKQLLDVATRLRPLLESQAIVISAIQSDRDSDLKTNSEANLTGTQLYSANPKTSIDDSQTNQQSTKLTPLIACIDDSIAVYKNLEKIITEHGYRTFGVQDPLRILPTLIKNKPDLIFLDLVMPITNGYEVCEQIRKTPSLANIPIIILTGSDGLIDRVRTKFVGANGFLGKPIEREAVIKMMDKYLDRKQSAKTMGFSAKTDIKVDLNDGKRILVVDDDRSIREVVSMCLHKLKGWDVVTAASGREGLNGIKTKSPDVIILDVMMPEMDGLAFLRNLRADRTTKYIPVVLLTANRYLPDKALLNELGVVEIVSKPFLPIDLVRQIDRALAGNACLV
jgi:two-component system, chemotaxis family, response regulator PixG